MQARPKHPLTRQRYCSKTKESIAITASRHSPFWQRRQNGMMHTSIGSKAKCGGVSCDAITGKASTMKWKKLLRSLEDELEKARKLLEERCQEAYSIKDENAEAEGGTHKAEEEIEERLANHEEEIAEKKAKAAEAEDDEEDLLEVDAWVLGKTVEELRMVDARGAYGPLGLPLTPGSRSRKKRSNGKLSEMSGARPLSRQ